MRASIIAAAAPFVAAALAQDTTTAPGGTWHTTLLTIPINGSTALTTYTYQYDNPQTSYLTQTNSNGVITGLPSAAVGTVPTEVATIPAGLPTGVTSIPLNISGTVTYFSVSVGSSTTLALGGQATVQGNSVVPTATDSSSGSDSTDSPSSGSSSGSDSDSTGSSNGGGSSTRTASGTSSSSTGNAASSVKVGTAGVIGLGAIMAAFL